MSRWQSKPRQTKTLSGKQMLAKQRLSLFLTFRENEWWRWRDTPQKHGDYDIDWDGKIDAMPGMHPFFKTGFREHYRIRPTESRASTMGFLDLLSPFPWVFDTGQSCLWKWTGRIDKMVSCTWCFPDFRTADQDASLWITKCCIIFSTFLPLYLIFPF